MQFTENYKSELLNRKPQLESLYEVYDIENSKERIEELHMKASEPGFWDDNQKSQEVLSLTHSLEAKVEGYEKLKIMYDDIETMIEMANEEQDSELEAEIQPMLDKFIEELENATLETLMTGEYDKSNAILSFHAGAGGTEAQDWTQMLLRMYTRWGEQHGFKVELLDVLDGGDAGIKSASVIIEGENAYGFLKSENGIHRLVRISPFDAAKARHTSFAAVEVIPEINNDTSVVIPDEDIEMQVFRASGAGGQHINKTSSAVRLTHKPTGIVTSCQTQRSQFQNKDYAMKMLVAKLVEIKEREHYEKIEDIKGVKKEIAWGSQIRSYVFMPYTLVKDHRTGYEFSNVEAVMDGKIDGFINAYLKALSKDPNAFKQ